VRLIDITPKSISESVVKLTLPELKKQVISYLEAGEIVNPEFQTLKNAVSRSVEKAAQDMWEPFRGLSKENENLANLYWEVPNDLIGVGSLKNKLKKFAGIDHPAITALQKFYDDNIELVGQMKELKTKVVSVVKKRAEAKVQKDEISQKQFKDSSSLVKELMVHIEDFVSKAEERALESYQRVLNRLEEHEMNIDSLAPQPHSRMSTGEYRAAQNYRAFINSLVVIDNGPFVKKSLAKKTKYIETVKQQAREDYLAWISKMIEKIGKPVVSAVATGNPWQDSKLRVNTNDGEEQIWHTQMIINTSKYGKLFNQFPSTRKS
jgi:anion-transporting  ArsA/GET3 family ATPase